MTQRERMLAAIRGETPDTLPWAPRMDLWSIALRARGTLPPEFAGMDTVEIARSLGVACHAVRGDMTRPRRPDDTVLRGLGFDNHPDYPFRIRLTGLPCEFSSSDGESKTCIRTPVGEVHTHLELTKTMARDGISLPFYQRHAIGEPRDFEAVACVFDDLRVEPDRAAYAAFRDRIGDDGIAVASGPIAASPMHLILHELMPMDQFFYLYVDQRKELEKLAARMEPFFENMLDVLASSEAEVVFWGGNYDRDLTWPPFFTEHIAPWLRRVSERLHAAGKFVLTHTDGENTDLLPLYPGCAFDVAESVCPAPMTHLTLAEQRAGMGPRTTVWGGIPSVALLPDSMDDQAFQGYLDTLFSKLGDGNRLILGVSDNVPPDAGLGRLAHIRERAEAFLPAETHGNDERSGLSKRPLIDTPGTAFRLGKC